VSELGAISTSSYHNFPLSSLTCAASVSLGPWCYRAPDLCPLPRTSGRGHPLPVTARSHLRMRVADQAAAKGRARRRHRSLMCDEYQRTSVSHDDISAAMTVTWSW